MVLALAAISGFSARAAQRGDVNGDGTVNVADVTSLINHIAGVNTLNATECDLNGDGLINVADVTALVNIIITPDADKALVGGDISLLPSHEAAGAKYFAHDGTAVPDVIAYLKGLGWNAMRVRLFVAPTNKNHDGVVQDLAYVKALGKRIKDAGLKFVLDFHYSDTWADPSTQTVPSRWSGLTAAQLADSVGAYTRKSLQALQAAGAEPDLVQVGNEVSYGMLWPTGHCYPDGGAPSGGSWANFASYLKAGTNAVREVCPKAKVIVHVELGNTMTKAVSFFTTAQSQGIDYDVIGLSYYPFWHGPMATFSNLLGQLQQKFPAKQIMVMETDYPYAWAMNDTKYDYSSRWAYSDAGQAAYLTDLMTTMKKYSQVQGLFWWWPEQNEYGNSGTSVTGSWWNGSMVDSRTGRFGTAAKVMGQGL